MCVGVSMGVRVEAHEISFVYSEHSTFVPFPQSTRPLAIHCDLPETMDSLSIRGSVDDSQYHTWVTIKNVIKSILQPDAGSHSYQLVPSVPWRFWHSLLRVSLKVEARGITGLDFIVVEPISYFLALRRYYAMLPVITIATILNFMFITDFSFTDATTEPINLLQTFSGNRNTTNRYFGIRCAVNIRFDATLFKLFAATIRWQIGAPEHRKKRLGTSNVSRKTNRSEKFCEGRKRVRLCRWQAKR